MLVGVPLAVSGAGGPATYACLTCAAVLASSPLEPGWIGEEIVKTRARLATHGRDPRGGETGASP